MKREIHLVHRNWLFQIDHRLDLQSADNPSPTFRGNNFLDARPVFSKALSWSDLCGHSLPIFNYNNFNKKVHFILLNNYFQVGKSNSLCFIEKIQCIFS